MMLREIGVQEKETKWARRGTWARSWHHDGHAGGKPTTRPVAGARRRGSGRVNRLGKPGPWEGDACWAEPLWEENRPVGLDLLGRNCASHLFVGPH